MHRASRIIRLICLGFVIPFVLSMVAYYGFVSNYTGGLFSEEHFRAQYESGIYRYRILGRISLLKINDVLEQSTFPAMAPRAIFFLDRDASLVLYTAYFLNNVIFLCLACGVLVLLFEKLAPPGAVWIGDLSVLLLCLLMAITQYVIVPYDTMTYFFLALAFYLIAGLKQDEKQPVRLALLGLVVVLGALTRETAALIPAFYAAVHHRRLLARPFRWNAHHSILLFLGACFLLTYAGMRLVLGAGKNAMFEDVQFLQNLLTPFALSGLLFALAVMTVLTLSGPGRRESVVFLLTSLPYLLFILFTARLWEIRLWVPVFLAIVTLKVWRMGAEERGGGEVAGLDTMMINT